VRTLLPNFPIFPNRPQRRLKWNPIPSQVAIHALLAGIEVIHGADHRRILRAKTVVVVVRATAVVVETPEIALIVVGVRITVIMGRATTMEVDGAVTTPRTPTHAATSRAAPAKIETQNQLNLMMPN
jgi:hypothetical protein